MSFKPSPLQEAIFEHVSTSDNNLVVSACAGGCLSEDTQIEINRAGITRSYSIGYIYRMSNGGLSGTKRWNLSITTNTRSVVHDDFSIGLSPIKNCIFSGEKHLFLLTTERGYRIKATEDHRFYTTLGWVRLRNLEVGDYLYSESGKSNRGEKKSNYKYTRVNQHPYKVNNGSGKSKVPTHRLIMEAHLNGLPFDVYLLMLRGRSDLSRLVFINPKEYHVHHIDDNKMNNAIENLQLLSVKDHLKLHSDKCKTNFLSKVSIDRVKSIEYFGIGPTFDIEMVDEEHPNFLANKIVVHNSKTSTQIATLPYIDQEYNTVMVAFNKDIAAATRDKVSDVEVRTYHSLGFSSINRSQAYAGVAVEEDKAVQMLTRGPLGSVTARRFLGIAASNLWNMARVNLMTNLNNNALLDLATTYDIELYDDSPNLRYEIFDYVRWLQKEWLNNTKQIDFTDQIWLPTNDDRISIRKFDVLLGDEVQDTNPAQLELLLQSFTYKAMMVGDENQAIYAWAGAGSDSMDIIRQRLHADELPLSICYRCTKATEKLVNDTFPHIPFTVPEWAKEGQTLHVPASSLVDQLVDGDMVICRVNADLVQLAFECIKNGKKAMVRGRKIGDGLSKLIKKQKAYDMADLTRRLEAWRNRQIEKMMALDHVAKVREVQDQFDTIMILSENCDTVDQLVQTIDKLFSDTNSGIVCTSGHRSKGLEAGRTILIRPDLMPHPMAKSEEAKRQELNLKYVAYTRSLGDFIIAE